MLRGDWLWSEKGVKEAKTESIAPGPGSVWVKVEEEEEEELLLSPFPLPGHLIDMNDCSSVPISSIGPSFGFVEEEEELELLFNWMTGLTILPAPVSTNSPG